MNYEKIFRSIIQKQPFSDVLHKANLETFALVTGKHLWRSLFYNQLLCKFCKILRSTFITEHFPVIASVFSCRTRVKSCLQRFLCSQEHIKLFSILI